MSAGVLVILLRGGMVIYVKKGVGSCRARDMQLYCVSSVIVLMSPCNLEQMCLTGSRLQFNLMSLHTASL